MAQVPATPKTTRAARLALARIAGPDAARRPSGLAASETAALALRKARAGRPRPEAGHVTFLIPLVGPADVGDWQAVTRRLNTTLESFRRQDDPRWRAVICCQEAPPLPEDERISHLPFDDPTPGNDKWRKLGALCRALPGSGEPGYVMSFDADDLLRQGSVAEMLSRRAPGGYLAETGFVRDVATGHVALAGPPTATRPLRKPFWKLCGSCAALLHEPDLAESTAFLAEMTQHEHRMFPYLAALAGQRLDPLSRPSVLYELNHGENFGARRGRVGFKTRFVARYRIRDADLLREVIRDFP